MTDEELMARLKASAPVPKEADDPAFWQAFEADLQRKLDAPPRRARWKTRLAVGLAAAAAAALMIHGHRRPSSPMPGRAASVDEVLLPDEDPTDLIGELDIDELRALDHNFHGGV